MDSTSVLCRCGLIEIWQQEQPHDAIMVWCPFFLPSLICLKSVKQAQTRDKIHKITLVTINPNSCNFYRKCCAHVGLRCSGESTCETGFRSSNVPFAFSYFSEPWDDLLLFIWHKRLLEFFCMKLTWVRVNSSYELVKKQQEAERGRFAETYTITCQFEHAREFCFPQWKKEPHMKNWSHPLPLLTLSDFIWYNINRDVLSLYFITRQEWAQEITFFCLFCFCHLIYLNLFPGIDKRLHCQKVQCLRSASQSSQLLNSQIV